jgi:hypothetical protein
MVALMVALAALLVVALVLNREPGTSQAEKDKKQAEKKKEEELRRDFELTQVMTRPHNMPLPADKKATEERENPDEEPESKSGILDGIKAGHWASGLVAMRANNEDFRGALTGKLTARSGRELDLDLVPYRLDVSRPVILPKAQRRDIEFSLFCPLHVNGAPAVNLTLARGFGSRAAAGQSPLTLLAAHQNYLVVVAKTPDSYRFLGGIDPRGTQGLDSIRAPGEEVTPTRHAHYYVVYAPTKGPLPLPNHLLNWTAIAYLVWDDRPASDLTSDQQQALLDWLHWGGQLIVSGPDTLETLRGSFLEPYLPATADGTYEIDQQAIASLNTEPWKPRADRSELKLTKPWTGVKLSVRNDELNNTLVDADSGPLLAERQVGRGRIVVSAFRLDGRELVNWSNNDGLWNAGLLRREPRRFKPVGINSVAVDWADRERYRFDPLMTSKLRFFARDASPPTSYWIDPLAEENPAFAGEPIPVQGYPTQPRHNEFDTVQPSPPIGPGVAGWNDFASDHNGLSDKARETLVEAAGIVVPDAHLVMMILGIYCLVLVPLNWGVFRLLGRVEWAWIAAPMISIVFAVVVVRQAQLDIGFVRSKNEVAVIELQGNHPRAHVTRYIALYSSLSSSYDLKFDDPSAVALPFPTTLNSEDLLRFDSRATVHFHRGRASGSKDDDETGGAVMLSSFEVASNTTGMLHSEQMYDLGGGITLERLPSGHYKLTNNTQLALQGAGVVGRFQAAWVGSLAAGESKEIELKPKPQEKENELWADELDNAPMTVATPAEAGLNLRRLFNLARDKFQDHRTQDGLRLVAWTEQEIPGLTIEPAAAQSRTAGLVIAHLRYASEKKALPDENTRAMIVREETQPNVLKGDEQP